MPDRFDDLRREWITDHQGISTIQKRRAQLLNRQIRLRTRRLVGARPSPYDDNVIHPIWSRRPSTFEDYVELFIVLITAILAPVGWLLGVLLYRQLVTFIPERLRAYPIPALLWTAAAIGVLTVLIYSPGESLSTTVGAPYLIAQVPATFAVAGVYGILNGWIAVDGSTGWWPLTPPPVPVDLDLPLGPDDLTAPPIFATEDHEEIVTPTHQIGQSDQSIRLVTSGLVACILGTAWMIGAVLASLL
ncbi:hypothetical protein KL864_25525 [Mycolicibacterium goodii]|uniref:hypothetical protein n=1 Tax=Mycolicibacterium goodii TaxID=134601 RepID=UPI001BDCA7BC|nr:hypothetical protein [Mycolicibacterium goodii]MBU8819259.1 hypothetical protein [Mycolicibacterium goodii]